LLCDFIVLIDILLITNYFFMAQQTREIKRRIKSVISTRKITKAMEMVAAAKMRKAIAKVLATRSYADLTWRTVLNLAKKMHKKETIFFNERKKIHNVAVVLISSNRGMCGSFNAQLCDKVVGSIKLHHPESRVSDIISFGTKGRDEARRRKLNLVADFKKEDITTDILTIRPIAKLIMTEFEQGKYDKVFVAYTDYASALKQMPHVKQILPITPEIDKRLGHIIHEKENNNTNEAIVDDAMDYFFEPSRKEILKAFLPRLIEVQIFQAVLESEASEHSSRMIAMKNASEAAADMITGLTLMYNKARQAGITAEIAEVSGGAAALD
jgi:F-type H+-transporting ATPase subunit gamma